jgi:hypothetical protein
MERLVPEKLVGRLSSTTVEKLICVMRVDVASRAKFPGQQEGSDRTQRGWRCGADYQHCSVDTEIQPLKFAQLWRKRR